MPEVPDLEAIRDFFNKRIVGLTVDKVEINIPIVLRVPREDFTRLVTGDVLGEVHRYGKFLLFSLAGGRIMVINPMLTGRFALVEPKTKKHARTAMVLTLSDGMELRYADQRVMGRIYLVTPEELTTVPQFADMGPDVLAPDLTEEAYKERLKRHSGQIKSILVNAKFVAGVGNAYADEILWEARVHPYRKRTQMTDEEQSALYKATHSVLEWAGEVVAEKMTESLDYSEWRDHLKVHRRGGQPCPRCGTPISEITAGQRITNFCRQCQP